MRRWKHLGGVDDSSGYAELARRTDVSQDIALGCLFYLYRGLDDEDFAEAVPRLGFAVPDRLRPFYRATNGARIFDMIGINGMLRWPRFRVAGFSQPISLTYGNVHGRPPGLADDDFVIGGLIGYSIVGQLVAGFEGGVRLVHPADGTDVATAWPTFEDFLFGEFDRLAALHDDDGNFVGQWSDRLPPTAAHWDSPPKKVGLIDRLVRPLLKR
jgi:hypothetical protein